ncbi:MAG TPA: SDR family NAD(P)-dependent oxidoreductase [Candidatus Limnocylindrales bacterium]|nr:SDR family NAD(P)-dependent oxidoreductase [Candidatus Limnocylindrales bacterium]
MERELAGRVAVVTGGASGIGLATARALGADGATVFLAVRDVDRGRRAVADSGDVVDLRVVRMDVTDSAMVREGFVELDAAGRLDIVVNNAGIDLVGRVEALSEADWRRCLDTNLTGAFLVAREAIPRLRRTGGGSIVNVASNAGLVARPDEPAYSAAKAGLLMLTRSLALAHAADRIRVNAVCPGPVGETDIMDRNLARASDPSAALASYLAKAPLAAALGRLIEPREVAAAIRYLCSDAAAMVTGATLAIDGGKSAAGTG